MDLIEAANRRLKAGRIGLSIEGRGGKLYLRGTLPPKPGSDRTSPYQQRVATGLPNNAQGIRRAEDKAKLWGAQLALGEFQWESDRPSGSVADWLNKFERHYWATRSRTNASENSWKVYEQVFRWLRAGPLTEEALIDCVCHSKPGTRSRQRYVMVCSKLARFAGLPEGKIKGLRGDYSSRGVEPRELPTGEQIEAAWEGIKNPGWRWVFGMMAAYGLRNHEVFGLDLSEWPTIWTHPKTKTGRRFVYPVPPHWLIKFDLESYQLPKLKELEKIPDSWDFSALGSKVSVYFKKRQIPFNPYSLRHCYARHCFEAGLRTDLAAKLMGHSLKLHTETYRQFWDEATFKAEYQRVFSSPGSSQELN